MYRINHQSNRITKIKQMKFTELGFSERNHLQEWLANQPDALGEELLILQKNSMVLTIHASDLTYWR